MGGHNDLLCVPFGLGTFAVLGFRLKSAAFKGSLLQHNIRFLSLSERPFFYSTSFPKRYLNWHAACYISSYSSINSMRVGIRFISPFCELQKGKEHHFDGVAGKSKVRGKNIVFQQFFTSLTLLKLSTIIRRRLLSSDFYPHVRSCYYQSRETAGEHFSELPLLISDIIIRGNAIWEW